MEISQVLKTKGPKVWSIGLDQTIQEALNILVTQKIGALLVMDKAQKIHGIISERDIMRECFHNSDGFKSTVVSKVMTKRLVIGLPTDEVHYIMGIMTQNRVRHVPILVDGKLHGLVSIGDVVKAQLQDSEYENRYLKEYMFGQDAEDNES